MDNERYVNNMRSQAAKEELIWIRNKLDELNEDDFFGTEGWKSFLGLE